MIVVSSPAKICVIVGGLEAVGDPIEEVGEMAPSSTLSGVPPPLSSSSTACVYMRVYVHVRRRV